MNETRTKKRVGELFDIYQSRPKDGDASLSYIMSGHYTLPEELKKENMDWLVKCAMATVLNVHNISTMEEYMIKEDGSGYVWDLYLHGSSYTKEITNGFKEHKTDMENSPNEDVTSSSRRASMSKEFGLSNAYKEDGIKGALSDDASKNVDYSNTIGDRCYDFELQMLPLGPTPPVQVSALNIEEFESTQVCGKKLSKKSFIASDSEIKRMNNILWEALPAHMYVPSESETTNLDVSLLPEAEAALTIQAGKEVGFIYEGDESLLVKHLMHRINNDISLCEQDD
ncbi:hypothetical protein GH714_005793 [Hevea brasiliensis]|uniref:Uncharacterized protein n=1 Tax=Hevea brasiliensis TaxID=3981 RepID=A0A6A6LE64_HEVBR|nr:hypothetical protein GH714_005793 [Hevea brasiliensis]